LSRHLLVIGAQRCGTSYLHRILDGHPDITMARPLRPEPKVFLSEEQSAKGLAWYRDTYFSHATTEQLWGEKSTSYLEHPVAAERAARVLGPAQIVVILRDPVQRAVSNWRFSSDNGLESRPLEEALRENLAGPRPWDAHRTSVSPFAYLERGRYVDYLSPWSTTFPATTHVVFLQDLLDDDAAIGELFAKLGVDPGFRPANRLAAVNASDQPAPELSTDLKGLLAEYFEASNAALSAMLGRDLPWWRAAERGATHA
jgi:hypothetical protein